MISKTQRENAALFDNEADFAGDDLYNWHIDKKALLL